MSLRASLCVLGLTVALTAQDSATRVRSNPPAAPGGAATRTAQQEVELLLAAAKRSDAVAFWNWLPVDHQRDIEGLVRELATRVDQKTYDRTWQLLRRAAKVAMDKQQFVFANPTISGYMRGDAEQTKNVKAAYSAVCRLVQECANSDLSTLDGLRKFDGRSFMTKSGKPILETLFTIARLQGQDPISTIEQTKVRTLDQDADSARIEMRAPGKAPEVETFVLSGGRWLPAEMERDWQKNIEKMQAKIAAMPLAGDRQAAAQANLVLGTVESYVRKFEECESQADFDEVCAELMALAGSGNQKARKR